MAKKNLPMSGVVVRVCGSQGFWRQSDTLRRLRSLGGKVVRGLDKKITHLVTIQEPIAPFQPNDGTMFGEEFSDYVEARSFVDALPQPAAVMSLETFKDWVTGIETGYRQAREAREEQTQAMTMSRLEDGAPKAYIGL